MPNKEQQNESETAYICDCGTSLQRSTTSALKRHKKTKGHQDWWDRELRTALAEADNTCPSCGFDPDTPGQNHVAGPNGCSVEIDKPPEPEPIPEPEISVSTKTAREASRQGYDIPGATRKTRQPNQRQQKQRNLDSWCEVEGHELGPAAVCKKCTRKIENLHPTPRRWIDVTRSSVEIEAEIERIQDHPNQLKQFRIDDLEGFPDEVNRVLRELDADPIHNIRGPRPAINTVRKAVEAHIHTLRQELVITRQQEVKQAHYSITYAMEGARSLSTIRDIIQELKAKHPGEWIGNGGHHRKKAVRELQIELNNAKLKKQCQQAAALPVMKAQLEAQGTDYREIIPVSTTRAVARVKEDLEERRKIITARRRQWEKREEQRESREMEREKILLGRAEQEQGKVNNITLLRTCPRCGASGNLGDKCWNKTKGCYGSPTVVPRPHMVQKPESPNLEPRVHRPIQRSRRRVNPEELNPGFIYGRDEYVPDVDLLMDDSDWL